MKPLFFALLLFAGAALAQEDRLITTLKSNASLKEKADACEELARVGSRSSVPVLAALLADEQLSHRARSALEAIDDPSVDVALRQALGQVKGPMLLGVIHSLGVRKDPQAVAPLTSLLTRPEPEVARAAALALGRLGGEAVPMLERALATGSLPLQVAVCEGLFRCAEVLPNPEAAALYDKLRALPNLPRHLQVAAWSGAVRSRGAQGVPLILEAMRTGSPVSAADALRVSIDLRGAEMTRALVGALTAADEDNQILVVQALGRRGDSLAASALEALAGTGSVNRRFAAIQSLVQLGHPSSLAVLGGLLRDGDPKVAGAALSGLAGWPGREADAAVVGLLAEADKKTHIAALGAVGQRRVMAAIPAVLKAAGDSDAAVSSAGFRAIGELGGVPEIPGVVQALLTTSDVTAGETALLAICERQPDPTVCSEALLPGLKAAKGEAKLALLRTLGVLGGPQALAAIREAGADSDESVRETACQALCDWPTSDALIDLARMMKSTTDPKLQVLALRGQLRLIPLQSVSPAQKAQQIQELLPSIERMKEQRLALSTIGSLRCVESLALVSPWLGRAGLQEEASAAAVAISETLVSRHPTEVAEILKQVRTSNDQLAQRARKVLAQVPPGSMEAGFTPIFNGRDLTGWEGKPGWWKVEDGALTAESTPEKPCDAPNYLVWQGGEPSDFELLADFRLSGAGNSGIQLRSQTRPNWDTSGYQADMSGDGQLVGFVYEHNRGLIAGRGERVSIGPDGKREVAPLGDAAELLKTYQKEAWNTYRILCRGSDITLFINGTLMCQFTDRDAKHAASKGIIALQMHPGPPMKVQFRNIRLKKL